MRLIITWKVVNVVDSMRILINGKASLWRQTKVRYMDCSSCQWQRQKSDFSSFPSCDKFCHILGLRSIMTELAGLCWCFLLIFSENLRLRTSMARLQLIGRIVLMDGERIERKAQSSLVRKPLSESARSPLMIMAMMIVIISMTTIVIIIICMAMRIAGTCRSPPSASATAGTGCFSSSSESKSPLMHCHHHPHYPFHKYH